MITHFRTQCPRKQINSVLEVGAVMTGENVSEGSY